MLPAVTELPPGVVVEAWDENGFAKVIDDWRGAGREGQGIVWIDVERATDWATLADLFDEMSLPGYERAMLGHVLEGVGPEHHGAEKVSWYSPRIANQLNMPGFPYFLEAFGLRSNVAPGPNDPPWVYTQPVHFLVGGRWLITSRKHGTASDGLEAQTGPAFPREVLTRSVANGGVDTGHRTTSRRCCCDDSLRASAPRWRI